MFNLRSFTALFSVTTALGSRQVVKRTELSSLFPVQPIISSWTTSTAFPDTLPLSDDTLKPFKFIKALSHNHTTAPDGVYSMKAHYPAGKPQGGFSFYTPGPDLLDLTTTKEVTYAYSVLFQAGFDWVQGGRIPGLCKL
jgi:hypothetical protein